MPSGPLYMGYDVENRMTSATEYTVPQELYAYDPYNRRVWKGTVNNSGVITAQEMYFYAANGKKLGTYVAQFGSPGQLVATDLQVHFGSRRVAHWAGSVINSQVILVSTTLDRVGSVRNAGSGGGNSGFYPYGEDKGTAAPNDQMKFATYTRDSATGLDYAMNRYYSNSLGRFMSPDPYKVSAGPGDPQSWNRYSYTRSDPVNRVDPRGMSDCAADFCVTGAAYGGDGGDDGGPTGLERDGGDSDSAVVTAPVGQDAFAELMLDRDYAELTIAENIAASALLDPKCAALFGMPGTAGHGNIMIPTGLQLFDELQNSYVLQPIPNGDPGLVTLATTAGQGMATIPLLNYPGSSMLVSASVVITLNDMPGGFFSQGLIAQAATLLHELGTHTPIYSDPVLAKFSPTGSRYRARLALTRALLTRPWLSQIATLVTSDGTSAEGVGWRRSLGHVNFARCRAAGAPGVRAIRVRVARAEGGVQRRSRCS